MKTTKTEVVTDIIVELIQNEKRQVLLIKRKKDPFKDMWALPGGFVETDEEVQTAAARELKEETGLQVKREKLQFLDYFDAPDRDPRGRLISFAFGVKFTDKPTLNAGDDAGDARWFPLNELPTLAFDHQTILARWEER